MESPIDTLIVGGGLQGLLVACILQKSQQDFVLLEATSSLGGLCQIQSPHPFLPLQRGPKIFWADQNTQDNLNFLQQFLSYSLQYQAQTLSPHIYSRGSLLSDPSFDLLSLLGDPPPFWHELEFYLQPKRLIGNLHPHEWVKNLTASLPPNRIKTEVCVKRIQLPKDADGAFEIHLEDKEPFWAKEVLFCASAALLPSLFSELSQKKRAKITKVPLWTSLSLDLTHPTISDSLSAHVLLEEPKKNSPPFLCVGFFHEPRLVNGKPMQSSQWLSFVETVASEDSVVTGRIIERVKKNLRRVFPQMFDGELIYERVLFSKDSHGHHLLPFSQNLVVKRGANRNFTLLGHEGLNMMGAVSCVKTWWERRNSKDVAASTG